MVSLEQLIDGELEQIARKSYHEAGHVLAMHRYGFRVKSATVHSDYADVRGAGGQVLCHSSSIRFLMGQWFFTTTGQKRKAEEWAVALLAAVVAESRYSGVPRTDLWLCGGKRDRECAIEIAVRLRLDPDSKWVEWEAKAVAFIDANWKAVECFAERLRWTVDILSGAELMDELRAIDENS